MKKKMIFFILIFLVVLAGVWVFFVEPNMLRVERITLELKRGDLSSSLRDLKLVHLSDLHSKDFSKKEKKVLKALNDLKPDFIFLSGDMVDWTTKDLEGCQKFWQKISQNYQGKVFAVLGNHEHRNPKFAELLSLFRESGIEVLRNQSKKITINGDYFYLIGVDDPHESYDDLEKALNGVEGNSLKILLAHSPEIFRKIKDPHTKNSGVGVDLVLTGHTHGGQINIPFLVNFVLPLKYDRKYKRGLFKEDSTYLYVNRGTGTTVLPLRFNSFPEITLIKFK